MLKRHNEEEVINSCSLHEEIACDDQIHKPYHLLCLVQRRLRLPYASLNSLCFGKERKEQLEALCLVIEGSIVAHVDRIFLPSFSWIFLNTLSSYVRLSSSWSPVGRLTSSRTTIPGNPAWGQIGDLRKLPNLTTISCRDVLVTVQRTCSRRACNSPWSLLLHYETIIKRIWQWIELQWIMMLRIIRLEVDRRYDVHNLVALHCMEKISGKAPEVESEIMCIMDVL